MMTSATPPKYLLPGMQGWRELPSNVHVTEHAPDGDKLSAHLLSSLQMENVLVLAGLGTSLDVGGPTMEELWQICVASPPSEAAQGVLAALKYDGQNIEELLSRCDAQLQASGDLNGVSAFRQECIAKILDRCRKVAVPGQHDLGIHREFIRRLARRRVRDPRLRIFTTNYDLSFERAAGELGLTTIDGFSFTSPRRFDPRYFDYDIVHRASVTGDGPNYVPGVFQYFKIHGSVDWDIDEHSNVTIRDATQPARACLIYPTRQKFQFSFQQPHLELMAQFLAALRQPNTCLLVVGFGFNDAHLTEPILSALETNPHLRLVVISPRSDQHYDSDKPVWHRLKRSFGRGEDVGFVRANFPDFVSLIPDLRVLTASERLERDIRQLIKN